MEKDRRSSSLMFLKYADWVDILLMMFGTFGAIGDGMSTNILLIFVSRLMNSLGYGQTFNKDNGVSFMDEIEKCSLDFVYVGLAIMFVAFLEGYCWSKTSERQVLKIRYKYLEALLRQEVGFFDSQDATTSDIIDSISKDTSLLQELLSEKVPLFIMHTSSFASGLAFSTYFSWRLTTAALPTILLLIIPGIMYGKYLVHLSQKSHKEHNKANTIIQQALTSIKTIYSFTAEQRIIQQYHNVLKRTTKLGIKLGFAKGLTIGTMGLSYVIWSYLAWYGGRLVMYRGESGGRIYASAICFVMSGMSLGTLLPEMKYFTEGAVAVRRIFNRIDRVPEINSDEIGGIVLDDIVGEIHFDNVKFTYPCRPDSIVLKSFNIRIGPGQTVALVGASGCGKSTVVSLLQRFYDADEGVVKINGFDIKTLNLKCLRRKMGLVSQDHALFGTSIRENIKFGKLDATEDEITAAAVAANAHNFIIQLPQGYDTNVGTHGGFLSGGQKQRISIARALVKNPMILLLDEATSALDSESESVVQNALDQASIGRTTLIVAHKLSTIRNADFIAVMSSGNVIESGNHEELIDRKNGHYAKLVKLQRQISCEIDARQEQVFNKPSPIVYPSPLLQESDHSNRAMKPNRPPSFTRLISLNKPEWREGLIGSISAAACGSVQPIYALTIGGMISAFFVQDHIEMKSRIRTYSLIFFALSLISFILNLFQHYNFAYMGEKLTKRIRLTMLEKILTFEAAWFDEDVNSTSALCSILTTEASLLKSLVADRVSLLVQTVTSVVIAMILGLVIAWKLAIVMIAIQPLTILCFYARKVLLSIVSSSFVASQNRSTQMAMEAVCNHRIVTSFESREKVLELFEQAQMELKSQSGKKAWLAGVGIGLAQGLTFLSWALDFWYGGKLVESGQISPGDVFKTFFILVSTGKVIAEAGSMTSDLAKGSSAVASVFAILDRQSLIQGSSKLVGSNDCKTLNLQKMEGRIDIQNVDFAYPSRPETLVLRRFCLEVKAGQSVGLVGKSGCGKSTVIGLIQRFYDADKGTVRVDGVDVRELNLQWYRMHLALVSQEPVIFSGTVRDNIAFGKADASENEVVEAARAANAHEFISSLKDGYETECGERGVQLSGGQKQRIAIARAIIRNPVILLLDEATSALDAQSEQVVQEALDRIMIGRTTVVVAHRLGTIKHMDSISYVADGKVTEQGSYAELKRRRGAFYNLASVHN